MRTNQQRLRWQAGRPPLAAALMPLLTGLLAGLLAAGARAQAPSVGLSSVHAQRMPSPTIGNFPPQQNDYFGWSFAVGDFDGDGRDDLAIGAPGEGIATADGQDGHVTILMGRAHSMSPSRARGLVAGRKGVPGSFNEHDKNFGRALAAGDFDGDGQDDLAIGAPFENLGALGDAGTQTILFGSLFADGFESGPGFEFWSSVTP